MTEPVLGIDLGTTNSVLASVDGGKPYVIPSRQGDRLTPSVVGLSLAEERVVGRSAQKLFESHSERVAFATKRFIGQRWTPELAESAQSLVPYSLVAGKHGEFRVRLGKSTLSLTQISAMILTELALDAQAYFGRPVKKAVITVPANFDDGQRQATKQAAQIAGLELLRIVNEPTAAALAYGLSSGFAGRALVYDLGGGTLDVSVLEVRDGVFEVKATGGHPQLGGEDFDNRLVAWVLGHVAEADRERLTHHRTSMQRVRLAAEAAKCLLSSQDEARIQLPDLVASGTSTVAIDVTLTRKVFDSLISPLVRHSLGVCEAVMGEAKISPKDVGALLLVGGSTRVPMVRERVEELVGCKAVGGLNPDEVVALGAAVQGAQIGDRYGAALLIDVASHSLGVGYLGRRVRRLIAKNTPVPVTVSETFLPSSARQTEATLPIYQGESLMCDQDTHLGEVKLKQLQAQYRSELPIEVTFHLATDGTLSVSATHPGAEKPTELVIEARTDLPPAEVAELAGGERAYMGSRTQQDLDVACQRLGQLLKEVDAFLEAVRARAGRAPERIRELRATLEGFARTGNEAIERKDWPVIAELLRKISPLLEGEPAAKDAEAGAAPAASGGPAEGAPAPEAPTGDEPTS